MEGKGRVRQSRRKGLLPVQQPGRMGAPALRILVSGSHGDRSYLLTTFQIFPTVSRNLDLDQSTNQKLKSVKGLIDPLILGFVYRLTLAFGLAETNTR